MESVPLKLLDLTLKPSGSCLASAFGDFTTRGSSLPKSQQSARTEMVLLRPGGVIELYAIQRRAPSEDEEEDDEEEEDERSKISVDLLSRIETRSVLRSLAPVRLPGNKRDVIAIGSDSGCLSVIDLGTPTNPKLLHCPTFGNAGCRRNAPGQYVASDPKGRAVMVSSVEKRKLVYVLNQDSAGEPTIASPLEAHRSRTVTFDVVGADNGYDNPIFAALEVQYPEYVPPDEEDDEEEEHNDENNPHDVDAATKEKRRAWRPEDLEKQLAYYELDLGLNHVSRRWAAPVHRTASTLAAVPGGADGPGGVLVGGEDWIEYRHESQGVNDPPVCLAVPRRKHHPPEKSTLVTRIVVHRQKRNKFFALCQTELGDVFKISVTLDPETKESVIGLTLHVMDTLPVASGLNISRMGVLFVSSEFGPSHNLYQFERIDLDDGVTVSTSSEDVRKEWEEGGGTSKVNPTEFFTTSTAVNVAPTFVPRRLLENLTRVYEMPNLSPTLDVLVGELAGGETSPQLYIPRGRGDESTLQILRHGSAVTELAVSDLPGTPGDVFVIQEIPSAGGEGPDKGGAMDRYIIVSFADATLVLSIGDTVEEVPPEGDSSIGFLTNAPTLACSTLSQSNGMVQVHPGGVRHVRGGLAKQWHCPGLKRIEKAGCNASQILISLAGSGEVIYFELDPMSGNLVEAGQVDLGSEVLCVDVGEIGVGRSRSPFAAVGCRDQTVRILNLLPPAVPGKGGSSGALLSQRGSTALRARPHSVCMQQFDSSAGGGGGNADIGLSIGLDDGSVLRTAIDPITGQIATDASPTRRFLGVRPVTVLRARVQDQPCALMLSSRPWVSRYDTTGGGGGAGTAATGGSGGGSTTTTTTTCPLSYVPLDHACPLRSEIIREGIVATAGTTLRILTVDDTSYRHSPNEVFNSNSVPLRYTPRGMCLCNGMLAIVEADVNDFGLDEKRALGFDPTSSPREKGGKKKKDKDGDGDGDDMDMDMDVDMDVDDDDQEKKKQDEEKKEEGGGGSDEDEEDEDDDEDLVGKETPVRGPVPSTPGVWGSCVRLVNPATASTLSDSPIELDRNEAALCCASVQFHSRGGESLLAVGTVTNYVPMKKSFTAAHIVLYRLVGTGGGGGDDGGGVRLQLLHKTRVEGVPLALAHFQGRLLAGVGPTLRLYEMGKRQLLRKCELRGVVPTSVRTLQTAGDRAYVGDLLHGVFFVRYDAARNAFALLGRDGTGGRAVTCQELLDVHTVAVGDKFGNVTVLRLPKGAASGIGGAGSGNVATAGGSVTRSLWETESDTPKLDALCQYYVGEVVTGMTRASLVSGHAEALIYVTITGRVGALVPLQSRDDVEFYQSLEMSLRSDNDVPTRFTGRDPMAYRSYYAPVKHVVDGDLCESYSKVLNLENQKKIADTMDRTVGEVRKKLEDTRNGLL